MPDPFSNFLNWARGKGINYGKVLPGRIQGKGTGLVARSAIKPGETLISVPVNSLITSDSVSRDLKAALPDTTIHGLLAAHLALSFPAEDDAWRQTWPSWASFQDSMPLFWRDGSIEGADELTRLEQYKGLLPPSLTGRWSSIKSDTASLEQIRNSNLLVKQREKLETDWLQLCKHRQDVDWDLFRYCWMIVNTRCFFYNLPLELTPLTHDDHMALCPFLDLANHSDDDCSVSFNETGFHMVASKHYKKGEEVCLSYGSHTNDTLLIEYGFMLAQNKFDRFRLDDIVLHSKHGLRLDQQELLRDWNYHGSYFTDPELGVCFRTKVAAVCSTHEETAFLDYLVSFDDNNIDLGMVNRCIVNWLDILQKEIMEAAKHINIKQRYPRNIFEPSEMRWQQLDSIHRQSRSCVEF